MNLELQAEEVESLKSIYGDLMQFDQEDQVVSVNVCDNVTLYVKMTEEYPSDAPPEYTLFAPSLSLNDKRSVDVKFNEIADNYYGFPLIYTWVEALKEIVENTTQPNSRSRTSSTGSNSNSNSLSDNTAKDIQKRHYDVISGETIVDRKSIFQGHCCAVSTVKEAREFLDQLLENKKIAQATHNILAYRIVHENGTVEQDVDEDGESGAAGKLLAFMSNIKLTNVAIVVTRWFGGIHLGPDRFRHINNAARQVLKEANFIK